MTNTILGTWQAIGTLNKDGSMNSKKAPVKFTFKDNGKGMMKLLFLPAAFNWDERNGEYEIYNSKMRQKMEIKDDMLITYPQQGQPCVFQRA